MIRPPTFDRLRPLFPKSRGRLRVDDRRVLSGIIFIQFRELMWKQVPSAYGPPKTLYNRWKRWSRMGVFATILTELAAQAQETEIVMIDATHTKAHRTASCLSRDSLLGQRIWFSFVVQSFDGVVDGAVEDFCVGEGLMDEIMGFEVAPDGFDVV